MAILKVCPAGGKVIGGGVVVEIICDVRVVVIGSVGNVGVDGNVGVV